MKFIFFILVVSPAFLFSQYDGFQIGMNDGKSITTSYVKFNNYAYRSEVPYVQIDSKKGPKLSVRFVSTIKGFDQNGDFRLVKPIVPEGWKKLKWAERVYHSDRVDIFHTDFTDESWTSSPKYKVKFFNYSLDGKAFKSINYKVLLKEIGEDQEVRLHLKKGRTVHYSQLALYTLGSGALLYSVCDSK